MDDHELHDWEVLDDSTADQTTGYLDGIERDSEGMIRSDYFSLDSHNYSVTRVLTDQSSVESDNPSWIDPVCDANYTITKPIGEFSSTDGDDDGRFVGMEGSNDELGVVEVEGRQVVCGGDDDDGELVSDLVEIESKPSDCEKVDEELENLKVVEARRDGDEGNRVALWWKLPLDLLKYCLFKASPVWTFSVAAAMMGVAILGRRLYRMKQKTRTLQLKVAVDDKKVSQVMSRAARLNEAFSIVKRSPIIRPSLPAAGIAPWPVMALR